MLNHLCNAVLVIVATSAQELQLLLEEQWIKESGDNVQWELKNTNRKPRDRKEIKQMYEKLDLGDRIRQEK